MSLKMFKLIKKIYKNQLSNIFQFLSIFKATFYQKSHMELSNSSALNTKWCASIG